MTAITSPPSPPDRSVEQRACALAKANKIRIERAVLKQKIRAHDQSIVPLVADPPEYLWSMKIMELLLAVPGIGPTKAGQIFRRSGVSPSKTFAGVTDRQRGEIVAGLTRRSPGGEG